MRSAWAPRSRRSPSSGALQRCLYRIEKRPKLRNKQGLYAVIATSGQILKRGHDLAQVLRVFERKPQLVE